MWIKKNNRTLINTMRITLKFLTSYEYVLHKFQTQQKRLRKEPLYLSIN
jgi:hypothetical protein